MSLCSTLVSTTTTPRTNLQRWCNYLRDVESPNSWIVMSFYTSISIALQRRVWKNHGSKTCYANMYICLVGDSGLGKGGVIMPMKQMFNKLQWTTTPMALDENGNDIAADGKSKEVAEAMEMIKALEEKLESSSRDNKSLLSDTLLFPCPADSATLRALTAYMARCGRYISYPALNKEGKPENKFYQHNSIYFALEDLILLFKSQRETKDIVDFLVTAWDCNDYKHMTAEHGIDFISRCCATMLAGTTPDNVGDLFTERLLREGLGARMLFIYESEPRFRKYPERAELDAQQKADYLDLIKHMVRLSRVYGPVTFSPEATDYLREWHENGYALDRTNKSDLLNHYYSRKLMHMIKLSMCVHFSEKFDRHVNLEEVKLAHGILNELEQRMDLALRIPTRNETWQVTRKILFHIDKYGPKTKKELWLEFCEGLKNMLELQEILTEQCSIGKLKPIEGDKYCTVKYWKEQEAKKNIENAL